MRFQHIRIAPEGSTEVTKPAVQAVVYVGDTPKPYAKAYRGKSNKPEFYYSFRSIEARDKYVSEWLDGVEKSQVATMIRRIERNAERSAMTNESLPVGTILRSSWGYDQTNVDFYMVIGHKGKQTVTLQRIGAASIEGSEGYMCDECTAAPDVKVGEPFDARMDSSTSVGFSRYKGGYRHWASKWDGSKCYRSWYA